MLWKAIDGEVVFKIVNVMLLNARMLQLSRIWLGAVCGPFMGMNENCPAAESSRLSTHFPPLLEIATPALLIGSASTEQRSMLLGIWRVTI